MNTLYEIKKIDVALKLIKDTLKNMTSDNKKDLTHWLVYAESLRMRGEMGLHDLIVDRVSEVQKKKVSAESYKNTAYDY